MKYSRFEELPVWRDAIELATVVYRFTTNPAFKGRYSLKDQLERAAVSISNNIAEGFERGTTQETLTFLYIARGSAGESRSILCLCERLSGFTDLRSEISKPKPKTKAQSSKTKDPSPKTSYQTAVPVFTGSTSDEVACQRPSRHTNLSMKRKVNC